MTNIQPNQDDEKGNGDSPDREDSKSVAGDSDDAKTARRMKDMINGKNADNVFQCYKMWTKTSHNGDSIRGELSHEL